MKLKDMVIVFDDGDWIESKDQSSEGVRLLQTGNIGEGYFVNKAERKKFISEETFEKLKCKEVYSGDILISRLPEPVGRACIVPELDSRLITAVDCTICRINEDIVNKEYLCYFFQSQSYYNQVKQKVAGTTRKRISRKNLEQIKVYLPLLDIQGKIVQKLNTVSELISYRKKQLEDFDLLVKSQFVEMFGDPIKNPKNWEIGVIRDVVSEVRYGTSRPAVEGGKYKYLRMGNITYNGDLDLSELKNIDIPDSEIEKCMVQKGDVLFNRTNSKELVGKTCVFDSDEPMVIAGYIIRVRVNEKVVPLYLSAVLNSQYGKQTLYDMCKAIVGQANINAQELQNIKLCIPPIELQNQFATFVQQVDKSKYYIQKK